MRRNDPTPAVAPGPPADPRPAWERIAYAWLEREVDGPTPNIGPPPRRRAEAIYDVQRWTVADHGLHFPAMESPELYVEELRAFFRHLR